MSHKQSPCVIKLMVQSLLSIGRIKLVLIEQSHGYLFISTFCDTELAMKRQRAG